MSAHKHTPGPLQVRMDSRWPFDILTVDAGGNEVFRRRLPAHSSSDRTAADAVAGVHLPAQHRDEWAAENSRAVADEVLRAAAPDMLEAIVLALPYVTDAEGFPEQFKPGVVARHVAQIRAAIAKATGEPA